MQIWRLTKNQTVSRGKRITIDALMDAAGLSSRVSVQGGQQQWGTPGRPNVIPVTPEPSAPNRAAARKAQIGDTVIIIAYG